MPVFFPPQAGGNLGNALALWSRFQNPGAPAGASPPLPGYDPSAPPGQSAGAMDAIMNGPGGRPNVPPGPPPPPSGNIVPQPQSWNGSDPWFNSQSARANGSVQQPPPSQSSNLASKSGGLLSGLGGLIGGI